MESAGPQHLDGDTIAVCTEIRDERDDSVQEEAVLSRSRVNQHREDFAVV
jgi:hypothetical protein